MCQGRGRKEKAMIKVPLRYLRILLTINQCYSKGGDINWQALFILKLMSNRLIVTYWSAPTMDLYRWGCETCLLSLQMINIGVNTPFSWLILAWARRFLMYLDYMMSMQPIVKCLTLMPNKYSGLPSLFNKNMQWR